MLCRALSVDSSRILGPCLAVIVVLSVAFPAEGEDFRILLVRETGVDRTSRLPVGRIVISSGYIGGLEEGQIGTVWRKNKYKGQIEIADLEVVEADAYEATCRFTVRHPHAPSAGGVSTRARPRCPLIDWLGPGTDHVSARRETQISKIGHVDDVVTAFNLNHRAVCGGKLETG